MMKVLNKQIAQEAAEWAIRVDSGPLDMMAREDLSTWLTASPAHIEEFLLASSILSGLSHATLVERTGAHDVLQTANANVFSLQTEREPSVQTAPAIQRPAKLRRQTMVALAALCVLGVVFWPLLMGNFNHTQAPESFRTTLGEQRTLQLEDGSLIHLNTDSEVSLSFTRRERHVDLTRGEALFDIESDPDRPFRVTAGDTVAEALGTVFNVRLTQEAAVVSVVEGKVKVEQIGGPRFNTPVFTSMNPASPDLVLSVGETARLEPSTTIIDLGETEIQTIMSWRERRIVFERQALGEIVSEFNRYNEDKLFVSDNNLSARQFSGTFEADDPVSFVMFLEQHHNVRSVTVGRSIYLEPRP
ncbi:MAG: FecR domain-containing protein [Pseudomonadota bacterium]